MKPKKTNLLQNKGFTLIEVIVTLVLAAIMGTMLVSLMGNNLTGSALPVGLVGDQYRTIQEMEKITSLYREEIKNGTLNINSFKTTHVDTNSYTDSANTGFITPLTSTPGAYTTSSTILRVTLRSDDQSVQTFFTQ